MAKKRNQEPQTVGDYIRRARNAQNMSGRALANKAGIAAPSLLAIERGEAKQPKPAVLTSIAEVLGLDLATVFALAGYATSKGLPTLTPYLRKKYPDLPPEAVQRIQASADDIAKEYGVPLRWPDNGEDEQPDDDAIEGE